MKYSSKDGRLKGVEKEEVQFITYTVKAFAGVVRVFGSQKATLLHNSLVLPTYMDVLWTNHKRCCQQCS